MTDDLARELEEVAGSVPPIPNDYASLRSLIQSLPPPLSPDIRSAVTGTVNTTDPGLTASSQMANTMAGASIGSESGSAIGVVSELFYGNANLLYNPAFENANSDGVNIPASPSIGEWAPSWEVNYVLNSGTAPGPTAPWIETVYGRMANADNPFNTAQAGLYLYGATSATDYTVKVWHDTDWWPGFDTALPYLVAAVKATLWGEVPQAACTILRARMMIVDAAGDPLATGDWVDFKARSASDPWTVVRLSVAYPRPSGGWYTEPMGWLLEVQYARSSAGTGADWLTFGEPVFALSATQAPPPYSPIIAKWEPSVLYSILAGDTYDRLYVGTQNRSPSSGAPGIWLGPGTSQQDTSLTRVAAASLKISAVGGSSADESLYIGDDSILYDVDMADRLGIKGQQDATAGGLVFGSGKKPEIYRYSDDALALKEDAATGTVPLIKTKTSDQQILNTNVLTNVTNLGFTGKANTYYAVRWVIMFTVDSATTDGIQFSITGPSGCLPVCRVSIPTTDSAVTIGHIRASGGVVSTASIASTTNRYIAIIEGMMGFGATPGACNLQAASDTATTGDVTIKAYSYLEIAAAVLA